MLRACRLLEAWISKFISVAVEVALPPLMLAQVNVDVMHGCNPPAEHTVNQSIGVTGQKPKCCIAACTGTPFHLDNCHFAAWMPHTLSADHRSPYRLSTPASNRVHCTMAFVDKGAHVQPEGAAYALPQLRITTTTPME